MNKSLIMGASLSSFLPEGMPFLHCQGQAATSLPPSAEHSTSTATTIRLAFLTARVRAGALPEDRQVIAWVPIQPTSLL